MSGFARSGLPLLSADFPDRAEELFHPWRDELPSLGRLRQIRKELGDLVDPFRVTVEGPEERLKQGGLKQGVDHPSLPVGRRWGTQPLAEIPGRCVREEQE